MTKERLKMFVDYWFSMRDQYRLETNGFTLDLSTLTDYELISIKWVIPAFLAMAPRILEHLKPKHKPEMRRAIAYLTDLHERQLAANPKCVERWEKRSSELVQTYKKMQNPELSQTEKTNLLKEHFGWE